MKKSKPPNSPPQTLSQLKTVWYKKLKESGFEDIETSKNSLINWSSRHFRSTGPSVSPVQRAAVEEYHRLAFNFLSSFRFHTELDKIIWEYHANGISMRNIAKLLHEAKVVTTFSTTPVFRRIRALRSTMFEIYQVHSGKTNDE